MVNNIFSVGMGYNWRDDDINEAVYNALENLHPLVRAKIPNPDAFLPQGIVIPCFAEIDEPLLIEFEDGDVLGISFSEGSCVRIELNTIPLTINPGTNPRTFHANRLFQNMIGKRLAAIEVTASTEKPEFTGSYGLTLNEQVSYIERVDIVYDDFEPRWCRHRMSFTPWYDYGWVEVIDDSGQRVSIPSEEIPWIVEGYIPMSILGS